MKIIDTEKFKEQMEYCQVPKIFIQDLIDKYPDSFKEDIPKHGNVFFFGETGTGKTLKALSCVLNWFKGKRIDPFFFMFGNVSNMLYEIKDTFNPNYRPIDPAELQYLNQRIPPFYNENKTPQTNILNKYTEPKILIMDDFGTQKSTDFSIDLLYLIINKRYEDMKITITTSNFSPEEIEEKIGDSRMLSRLLYQCQLIHMTKQYRM